jgi:hypothetical protein
VLSKFGDILVGLPGRLEGPSVKGQTSRVVSRTWAASQNTKRSGSEHSERGASPNAPTRQLVWIVRGS